MILMKKRKKRKKKEDKPESFLSAINPVPGILDFLKGGGLLILIYIIYKIFSKS